MCTTYLKWVFIQTRLLFTIPSWKVTLFFTRFIRKQWSLNFILHEMSLTPQFLLAILVCRGQLVKTFYTCCGEMKPVFVGESNFYFNVKKTLLSGNQFLVGNFISKTPTDTINSKVWQYSLWYHHFKRLVVFSLVPAIHKSGSFLNCTIHSKTLVVFAMVLSLKTLPWRTLTF